MVVESILPNQIKWSWYHSFQKTMFYLMKSTYALFFNIKVMKIEHSAFWGTPGIVSYKNCCIIKSRRKLLLSLHPQTLSVPYFLSCSWGDGGGGRWGDKEVQLLDPPDQHLPAAQALPRPPAPDGCPGQEEFRQGRTTGEVQGQRSFRLQFRYLKCWCDVHFNIHTRILMYKNLVITK